jgi:O-antigen/teichoic acid export membrane protein
VNSFTPSPLTVSPQPPIRLARSCRQGQGALPLGPARRDVTDGVTHAETLCDPVDSSTTLLHRNVTANILSNIWSLMIGFFAIPLYLRVVGIEGYGLVGFYASLAAIARLLDAGLSPAFSRELARSHGRSTITNRDLLRSLETIAWSVSFVIAVGIGVCAGWIAGHWLSSHSEGGQIGPVLAIMGVVVGLQFPLTLYTSGLIGLEQQVVIGILNAVWATARAIGALLVLWFVSPTITAYFGWQAVVMLGAVTVTACVLRRQPALRGTEKPRFSWDRVRSVRRLAAGLGGISVLSVAVTQTDKLILARLLPLRSYGYYMLASVVASGLYVVIVPIQIGVYPGLVKLVALGDAQKLAEAYHHGCQLLTVLLVPAAAVIACFSPDILRIWTGDPEVVRNAGACLTLLAIGTALNGFIVLPSELQVAHGWTRLHFNMHLVVLLILIPATIVITPRFGPLGAAANWFGVNVLFLTMEVVLMHRRVLVRELRAWCVEDVLLPSAAAVLVVLVAKAAVHLNSNRVADTLVLLGVWAGALLASAALTRIGRRWAAAHVLRLVQPV